MLDFIWRHIPNDYKFDVAFKKIGAMAGKAIVGLLVGSQVAQHVPHQYIEAVGTVVTVGTTMLMEGIHDWAKMKYPNAKWL